jgi:hypothetical protein
MIELSMRLTFFQTLPTVGVLTNISRAIRMLSLLWHLFFYYLDYAEAVYIVPSDRVIGRALMFSNQKMHPNHHNIHCPKPPFNS